MSKRLLLLKKLDGFPIIRSHFPLDPLCDECALSPYLLLKQLPIRPGRRKVMEKRKGLAVTAAMTLKLMSLRLATARLAGKQFGRARQQQANKAGLFFSSEQT